MDDFLQRAAAVLRFDLMTTGINTWEVAVPSTLHQVFGSEPLAVTTDKQLAALDPQLQLLSPNSSLTLKIAEQLRTRGRPTHRAAIMALPTQSELLNTIKDQSIVNGLPLTVGASKYHLLMRIVYRVRFEREVLEERMMACCVDYETGQIWPAGVDVSTLRELLEPLPPTNLSDLHIDTALKHARVWLELQLYPQKAIHEAELAQLLAVEHARINAFYDALSEDSGLAFGAKKDDDSSASLEEERSRLLEEQEYRYALTIASEVVSVATIYAPVTPVGTAAHPNLVQHCVLFEPMVQLPRCQVCQRAAHVSLVGDVLVCEVCADVVCPA